MEARRSRRTTRSARLLRLVALLAVLTLGGWAAWSALAAASGPAAPTISSSPVNPTNQTSASFTYTDSQAVAKFQCALDGSAFTDCGTTRPSTKSYPGPLAQGSHTFQVRAVDSKGNLSSATSYSWVIDTTAPTVSSINRAAANPTNAASVSWTVTFSEAVKNVVTGNFTLVVSGLGGSPAITALSGSGASYTVTASTGSGNGSLGLNLSSKGSISDLAGNGLGGSVPVTGQVYTLDRTPPPAPTITSSPANPSNQTTASFAFTDSEPGVSFLCKLDSGSYAACSSPAGYSMLAQGSHTFSVEAKDAAGNISTSVASSTWTVDTTPPPAPTISSGPPNNSTSTSATFTFTDSEAGASFICQIDTSGYSSCTSPKSYSNLSVGNQHEFDVRAVDAAGNQSSTTPYLWQIKQADFSISGSAVGLLYPGGVTRTIPLTLSNPNPVPLTVTALAVSISGLPTGCSGSGFQLTQSNVSSTSTVTIPANGTLTLTMPPAAPTIQMFNLANNQDACQNATVSLSYSGSAHS